MQDEESEYVYSLSELVEELHARAKLIVEHERLFPWRQTYCRYLHVAKAVAEDEA